MVEISDAVYIRSNPILHYKQVKYALEKEYIADTDININFPYILVFIMGVSKQADYIVRRALEVGKKNNCQVILIGDQERWYKYRQVKHFGVATPREFIKLIDSAKCVFTNSFHQKYWMHLKHLSEHYGHQVTSQILRFAVEQDVSVIVLPRYNQEYSRNVMKGSGNWGSLHLSTRIRQYLDYKAWKNGIIVIEVHATGISKICAKCGAEIIRTDTRTELCCCANGHQTNRYLNAVRNLGKKCLTQFGRGA